MTLQVIPFESVESAGEAFADARHSEYVSASTAASMLEVSRVHVGRLTQSGHLTPALTIEHGRHTVPLYSRAAVELLAAIRSGEIGDVLDRIDVQAAAADPVEDRNAYVRAAWIEAIRAVAARNDGKFSTGKLRAHLPEDARGHTPGALITGLVRGHRIKWTGEFDTLNDPLARHSSSPCKEYIVIGEIA